MAARFDRFGIFANDLAEMMRFYRDVLGLAIDYPTFAEVNRVYARMLQAGERAVIPPRNEPWGMRSSFILNPEGNLIELGSWGKGQ